jgi:tryptophan-rich sensory protein
MIKIINIIMFAVMIGMNYLANALPLNGKTTGALSAQYPNLFVPAGITFSIWGVIYLLLLVYCVLQFREQNKQMVDLIGWAFAISCALNALWIVAWHYQNLPVSLVIMIALLAILIYINSQLKGTNLTFAKAAFGIYLGWICIATIANVTALLVNYGWNGWGVEEYIWTILMIAIGLSITSITVLKFGNPYIGLAVIWAFAGILIKRYDSISGGFDYPPIAITAIIAIILMTAITIYRFIKTV